MICKEPTPVEVPIGRKLHTVQVPNLIAVAQAKYVPGVSEKQAEIRRALREPIGTLPLRELARGRKNVVIVINDITRPYPGGLMVEELARELNEGGIPDEGISLLVAYGMHRPNSKAELAGSYGEELLERFALIHHNASDPTQNVTVGHTKGGVEVCIDRAFAGADLKILTGCIAPHQFAGFSGGRKSVVPGIAGFEAIRRHHSFPIRPKDISLGVLEGNRFHQESLEAAAIAGTDFILNAVENPQRELVCCVAGSLTEAFEAGVEVSRRIWTVPIPRRPEIAIVSPGGFPRDFDLHQSQKSIGCAEMVCPEGGGIILCAQCPDGAGRPGKLLREAKSLDEVIDRFLEKGLEPNGNGKAYMLARAAKRFRIILAGSDIPQEELRQMFLDGYPTVEEAIEVMLGHYGNRAGILVIPNASEIIPVVENGPEGIPANREDQEGLNAQQP